MHDRGNAGSRMTETDWRSDVRTSLARHPHIPALSEEVIEELAAHLEEVADSKLAGSNTRSARTRR